VSIALFLIFIALLLAILAVAPVVRAGWLLNVAVVLVCIALVIESGFVHA